MGRFYYDKGDYNKALEEYAHAVRVQPALPDARYSMAVTLGLMGRNAEAEAMYRSTIAAEPGHVLAYHNLAATLADEKRLQEACDVLAAGLQLMPKEPRLKADMAEVQRRMQAARQNP
jgi:tetratricopeptide (TPR) repeat protein